MAIPFHPKLGQVLSCDFRGNIWPEIDKKRPVVVFTPKYAQRADLVAVVPLSTTPPPHICNFHCVLDKNPVPGEDENVKVWAKCDLIQTVTFSRLFGYWDGKAFGKRNYLTVMVSNDEMLRIKRSVLCGLGFAGLTAHII